MKLTQHPITQKQLQAYYACALLWLVRLVDLLLRWTNPRANRTLKRIVQRQEHFIGYVLLLTAMRRSRHKPTRQLRVAAHSGFRRTRGGVRLLMKSAKIARPHASIRARVLNLLDVLADPERIIAYFIKRLRRGVHVTRLVAAAPLADALTASPPRAVACADSS